MNKEKLTEELELTNKENPYNPRSSTMEKFLYEVFRAGAQAQLDKVQKSTDLYVIDDDQNCKIQRLGSDEITETNFPALYDNIRRVTPLSEMKEVE